MKDDNTTNFPEDFKISENKIQELRDLTEGREFRNLKHSEIRDLDAGQLKELALSIAQDMQPGGTSNSLGREEWRRIVQKMIEGQKHLQGE
ncbi:hypothetical protein GKQ38_00820 [Candidatus Nanohaloarchaea archaeon]|nr:hypothetical protein GKQ38_00820 [Candidatus Nanohaloarchaea archaeon]